MLGIKAEQGRTFASGEDEPSRDGVVVLSNGFWRFEFIRLVTKSPLAGFYDGTKPAPSLILNMFFATEGLAEVARRAGGPLVQNLDRSYTLTEGEKAYLASLGVNTDPLLTQMNRSLRGFTADKKARRYAERYYEPSGRLRAPVLTIHTTIDGLASSANERVSGHGRRKRPRIFVASDIH